VHENGTGTRNLARVKQNAVFLLHIGGLLVFIWRICERSCLYVRERERASKKHLPELTLLHGVRRMEKNGQYMKTTRTHQTPAGCGLVAFQTANPWGQPHS